MTFDLIRKILDSLRERRRRRAIRNIREMAAFFGRPIDHLTDVEIEKGAVEFSRMWAQCGVTVQQAADSLFAVGKALDKSG